MEKYYSSVLTPSGLLCNYKILCEKHPESKFYIIPDGTDFERSVFFEELEKYFKGYNTVTYSAFYDEALNGIYLKSFDTYILADGIYSRVCPVSPSVCENQILLSEKPCISSDEKRQIAEYYSIEKKYYKKAVSFLRYASVCKENRNSLLSDYLVDERMINALKRILKKIPMNVKQGKPTVKFLSAVTPLGIHTLWNTVFENFETVIEIEDEPAFSSAIIAGIIRDRLISANEEFALIPDLFHRTIPQMILLPQSRTAIIRTDKAHPLPFAPECRINTEKFTLMPKSVKSKFDLLTQTENAYIENAVSCIYEGGDARRKMNRLLLPYSDAQKAKRKAENLFKKITEQNT